jgi:hypothetical protein
MQKTKAEISVGVSTTFESDDRNNLCFDGLYPSSETVTKTADLPFAQKIVKSTFRVATSDWSAGNFAEIG